MANYYNQMRSNYFWVKDDSAFLAWVATLPSVETHRKEPSKTDSPFALFAPDGAPSFDIHDKEVHFSNDLAPHLADGQVAVLIDIGAEKLRYFTGDAVAIHSDGRSIAVSLNDIYQEAEEAFEVDDIPRAEY